MTDREKIIEIIAPIVSAHGKDEAIADALIEAGYGDKEDWREYYKQAHDVAQRAFRVWDETFVKLWEAETRRSRRAPCRGLRASTVPYGNLGHGISRSD